MSFRVPVKSNEDRSAISSPIVVAESQESSAIQEESVSPAATDVQKNEISLKRKFRPGETAIQAFLFLCGALSILITVGIVYELGKEALLVLHE